MNKKKVFVTLGAAMTIVIAILYTMSQLGGSGGPGMGPGPKGEKAGRAGKEGQEMSAPRNANAEKAITQVEAQSNIEQTVLAPTGEQGESHQPNNRPRPDMSDQNPNSNQGRNQNTAKGVANNQAVGSSAADVAEVGVVEVYPTTYNAKVKGYGQASATHMLTLSAQVSGQITALSPRFETGALLEKGEVMANVDNTDYRQALAAAEATYETAFVALEEERLQGLQAQDEWTRSGLTGEPESALVLRAPQLKSAQAALREAEQNVAAAKRDLAFANISAPFNALVVSRSIQPGSYVQVGTEVASLYSADVAEISIPLSPSQWAQLPQAKVGEKPGWEVQLTDTTGEHHWRATIERVELHQDEDTRQRRAIAVVEKPLSLSSPLYFGTFLVAEIEGRALDNVWKVPSSAISQKQEVWFVAPDTNLLNKFTPRVLFEYEGFAYIQPMTGASQALIVARPLNNYLVNTLVKPVVEGNGNE